MSAQERNSDLDSIRSVSPASSGSDRDTPEEALQRLEDITSGLTSNRRSRAMFSLHSRRVVTRPAIARRRERPRQTVHRLLPSLFNTTQSASSASESGTSNEIELQQDGRRSSNSSQNLAIPETSGSHNSVGWGNYMPGINHSASPGPEFVSPGAFLFNGPSIRSSSTLGLCGNDSHYSFDSASVGTGFSATHRVNSTPGSGVTDKTLGEFLFEPHAGADIPRSISETMLHNEYTPDIATEPSNSHSRWERSYSVAEKLPDSLQALEQPRPVPHLPPTLLKNLLSHLDSTSYNALRLTCKEWSVTLDTPTPPKAPRTITLPNEILQQVYAYTSPSDFNAARHTCRSWMLASLDKCILVTMLKRGGWWSSAEADLIACRDTHEAGLQPPVTEEWFLSRRISRECALEPAWTGNGLDGHPVAKALVQTACTDFSDLASGYAGPEGRHSGGLVFTVSVCGKFVLVAEGGMIYVYQLDGNALHPITSVVCPRRVLAMSMDASSRRFAVAALLDGRMGIVCELQVGQDHEGKAAPVDVVGDACQGTDTRTSCFTSTLFPTDRSTTAHGNSFAQTETPTLNIRTEDTAHDTLTFNAVSIQNDTRSTTLTHTTNPTHHERNLINQTWNLRLRGTRCLPASRQPALPPTTHLSTCSPPPQIETGFRSLYRHLCSDDDPPRSVAICPQRRCVAFGCGAGVELHWVDALTGQDLNRWFPLSAPSDHLYFLPAREGDNARRLRLISSAAHPGERPAICRRFCAARPQLGSLWAAVGVQAWGGARVGGRGRGVGRSGEECDHYRAVPLSDGFHILFTDPETGLLCLGSDAPLGGSVKLLRKVVFVPPEEVVVALEEPEQLRDESQREKQELGQKVEPPTPRLYAATADLRWGVRVAVAYGDHVALFSVPSDVFAFSRREMASPFLGATATATRQQQDVAGMDWLRWWPDADRAPPSSPAFLAPGEEPSGRLPRQVWPLRVRGQLVGRLNGLVDLAVNYSPELTVWGFDLDGRAVAWQVDSGRRPLGVVERTVATDGRIVQAGVRDGDGDVVMADDKDEERERDVGFDGKAEGVLKRVPGAFSVEKDEDVEMLDVPPGAWYDEDGDMVMVDAVADA